MNKRKPPTLGPHWPYVRIKLLSFSNHLIAVIITDYLPKSISSHSNFQTKIQLFSIQKNLVKAKMLFSSPNSLDRPH